MGRIIFINRYFFPDHSATSQLLTDLASDLARSGKDVRVITSRQLYDDPQAQLPQSSVVQGVKVYRVWTSRFGRQRLLGRAIDYASFYLSATARLARLASRGDVVIPKTDPPLISAPATAIARLRGASVINWVQDLFPEVAFALGMKSMRVAARPLRLIRNISLRSAKLNVVLGERMAEKLRSEGVADNRIQVIPNWSDGQDVRPIARPNNSLRQLWNLGDRFVVGYSGNMGRAHEFDTILGAAERLVADERVVFVFVGGGAKRAWLQEKCIVRKLANVVFKPYQPRSSLAESLSVADVHLVSLQPALEGLIVPSKFYGIAAAGRPTLYIGDRDGEVPRLLREYDCGETIGPGDGASLAKAISKWASDPTAATRMGANARRLFETRFDRPIALDAWQRVLQIPG